MSIMRRYISDYNGQVYVKGSFATQYLKSKLKTKFGIPSYRTLRYWALIGRLSRPKKFGKYVYYNCKSLLKAIKQ
jgi:hypothetical protein